ncbi:MAG: glycosyltransferase family 2 protein, partial [Sphingobacteriales bacterium]
IVIPVYNQKEQFLRECIESAMAQTYTNIKIIISDNHSTNNVPHILSEYAAKDSRIEIVKPPVFLNISESFMYSLSRPETLYACYVSSDDILMPNCVEELLKGMQANKDAVFGHGKALYFYPDGRSILRWEYFNSQEGYYTFNDEIATRLLRFEYICFGGMLVDVAAWRRLQQRLTDTKVKINYSLDIFVTLLLFEQGGVYYSDKTLAKIRIENETRNTRMPYMIEDTVSIFNFIETDETAKQMISTTTVDVARHKKLHFLNHNRVLYYPFFEKHFDYKQLKLGFTNLKKYKLPSPFYFSAMEFMATNFPGISKIAYKIGRPVFSKIFKNH